MRCDREALAMALGALVLSALPAQAGDEKKVDIAKVPAAARKAAEAVAEKEAAGTKLTKATTESKDGETIYELAGKNAKGQHIEVEVTADGEVEEVEVDVPLSEVPKKALAAAQKASPGSKFKEASKETKKGEVIYEVSGKDAKHNDVEVKVTPEGKVLEVEVETAIPVSEVPDVVTDALKAKVPGFKATEAEEVKKDGKVTEYEFEGKNASGKELEVTVDPKGKVLKVKEE